MLHSFRIGPGTNLVFLLAVVALNTFSFAFGWQLFSSRYLHLQGRFPVSRASNTPMAMYSNDKTDDSFRVLGVCGGIGSGKSTACKLLVSSCNCFEHIDADKLAHSIYAPGSQAVKDVVATFGREILVSDSSMEIDRKKLGAIVFADRSEMAKLEEIVWPHVKTLLADKIQQLKEEWNASKSESSKPIVVLEAAILLDAGWDDMLDGVWAVTVPREKALARLMETRGLTAEEATKRIDAQESRRGIGNIETEVENGAITNVIVNDGSLDDLQGNLEVSLANQKCWKISSPEEKA